MTLTGTETIYDGFFMCDPVPRLRTSKSGVVCRPFAKKRGLVPGGTVDEVLEAAIEYRDKENPNEALYIAVFVRSPNGILARYSAKVAPGQTKAEWGMSG